MPSLPYIQLYVADYLSDTAHLTTEEHGAYLLLIFNYWQRGKALDNTNNRLANVVRLSNERWNDVQKVLAEYFTIENDQWSHTRIDGDLARVDEVVNARSRAGIKSGQVRRNKSSTNAEQMLNYKIIKDNKRKDKNEIYSDEFLEWWNFYPRRDGSKRKAFESFKIALTKVSLDVLISKAKEYADDPNRDPAYTALATTWLNQDRWESEGLPTRLGIAVPTKQTTRAQKAIELANELRQRGE